MIDSWGVQETPINKKNISAKEISMKSFLSEYYFVPTKLAGLDLVVSIVLQWSSSHASVDTYREEGK